MTRKTGLNLLQHFYPNNIAVLLKAAPLQTLESGRIDMVKTYYVLALVHPSVKSGERGEWWFLGCSYCPLILPTRRHRFPGSCTIMATQA